MTKKRRWISCFLAVLFVLVMLSSLAFIVLEAEHDCTGEDCPVCGQLAVCENALKLGLVSAVFISACLAGTVFSSLARLAAGIRLCLTPVALKVKLSN